MKYAGLIFVVGTALVLCACLPVTTKNPIGSTAGFRPDETLRGMWRAEAQEGPGSVTFLKNKDDSLTAIVSSQGKSGEADDWEEFLVRTATLDGNHFMSAREELVNGKVADDGLANRDIPIVYRVRGETLTLDLLDEKKTAAAIKSGAIAGTVEPGDYGDVRITASAGAVDAFFRSAAGMRLFSNRLAAFKRVR